ncbi:MULTISPECIES: hypothetical protein [unclassified Mesorhizobium]|uniref:hypothetical protein n=3 Tax=Mesorhizobium TaxID=68287 RepID=UPI002414D151|nr:MULTISPECIES: hypothetical protein [unclassified Mesorhizobium]MDG4852569.1 hypothetical protein [Mesorhizobium sp. WSM4982]MDG4912018.1 hypothetical protein [Mesorhizobium sp. WSM4983]
MLIVLLGLGLLCLAGRGFGLRRLLGRCGLGLLLIPLLPAQLVLRRVVVGGRRLFGRLLGRCGFGLLLLALLPARLLFVARRRRLFGGLLCRRRFGLLLLALLPARLLFVARRRGLFGRLLGRCGFGLLLALLLARLLLVSRSLSALIGRGCLDLLLLIAFLARFELLLRRGRLFRLAGLLLVLPLPARLLLGLGGLFGRRRFRLLLALLFPRLLGLPLLALRTFLSRLAFGAVRLR